MLQFNTFINIIEAEEIAENQCLEEEWMCPMGDGTQHGK